MKRTLIQEVKNHDANVRQMKNLITFAENVCSELSITYEEMRSESKKPTLAIARHLIKDYGEKKGCNPYQIAAVTNRSRATVPGMRKPEETAHVTPAIMQRVTQIQKKYATWDN